MFQYSHSNTSNPFSYLRLWYDLQKFPCLDGELRQADVLVDVGLVAPLEDELVLRVAETFQLDVTHLDVARIVVKLHGTGHVEVDPGRVTNHRISVQLKEVN